MTVRVPTPLKVVNGTFRPDRANFAEPTPVAGIPAQPANLSYGAKREWKSLSVMLDKLGVLTTADGLALGALCEAVDDLTRARKALRARDGLTYENVTAAGGITWRPWPEIRMISEADHRMQGWLSRFGLTPTDRAKVSTIEKETSDPAKRYFR